MIKNVYNEVFISWLKYHNYYASYYYNRNKASKIWHESFILNQIPENYIDCAFEWDKTKEGHSYWRDISYKWVSFIFKFKKDYENGKIRGKVNYGRLFIRNY